MANAISGLMGRRCHTIYRNVWPNCWRFSKGETHTSTHTQHLRLKLNLLNSNIEFERKHSLHYMDWIEIFFCFVLFRFLAATLTESAFEAYGAA